jgi:hypothetical protein
MAPNHPAGRSGRSNRLVRTPRSAPGATCCSRGRGRARKLLDLPDHARWQSVVACRRLSRSYGVAPKESLGYNCKEGNKVASAVFHGGTRFHPRYISITFEMQKDKLNYKTHTDFEK